MKYIGYLMLSYCVISGCNRKNSIPNQTKEPVHRDYAAEGYAAATVKDMSSLDGCGYLFLLPDGSKLNPISILDRTYRNDGLKVWIKYRIRKGVMTTCMSGKNIEIIDLALRKE